MKYDFTSLIDRHGKDASAVDSIGQKNWGAEPDAPKEGFDAIPMWVADMNFATCPAVTDAIIARARHPLFGYFQPSDAYYDSIIHWQVSRNGYKNLKREYIGYENGVHGCVTSAVETLSAPGDKILLHAPVSTSQSNHLPSSGDSLCRRSTVIRVDVNSNKSAPYSHSCPGSGTTGRAAMRVGRRFIGIDIDPNHCASAAERIAAGREVI